MLNQSITDFTNQAQPQAQPTTTSNKRKKFSIEIEDLQASYGFADILRHGKQIAFKGKGFEEEDLDKLFIFYTKWADNLTTEALVRQFGIKEYEATGGGGIPFSQVISQTEKLCKTKRMKIFWKEICGRNSDAALDSLESLENEDEQIQKIGIRITEEDDF